MVAMSREAISLTEANQTLQEELAEAKRMGQTGVEDLRSEFTRRLATEKLQAVVKVRVQNDECVHIQASTHVEFLVKQPPPMYVCTCTLYIYMYILVSVLSMLLWRGRCLSC